MKHDLFDQYFDPCTAVQAEGARIGLATCNICGATVMLDPRDDKINRARQHIEWHGVLEGRISSNGDNDD